MKKYSNIKKSLDLLELDRNASMEDAKRAYKDMVNIWHPDRFSHDTRLQQKAEKKLKEINEAFSQVKSYLSSPNKEDLFSQEGAEPRKRKEPKADPKPKNEPRAKPHAKAEEWAKQATGPYQYQLKILLNQALGKKTYTWMAGVMTLITMIIFFTKITPNSPESPTAGVEKTRSDTQGHVGAQDPNLSYQIWRRIQSSSKEKDEENDLKEFDESLKEESYGQSANDEKVPDTRDLFDIHLKDGVVITTKKYWEEGDNIKYRKFGGTVGVKRSDVLTIKAKGSNSSAGSTR